MEWTGYAVIFFNGYMEGRIRKALWMYFLSYPISTEHHGTPMSGICVMLVAEPGLMSDIRLFLLPVHVYAYALLCLFQLPLCMEKPYSSRRAIALPIPYNVLLYWAFYTQAAPDLCVFSPTTMSAYIHMYVQQTVEQFSEIPECDSAIHSPCRFIRDHYLISP